MQEQNQPQVVIGGEDVVKAKVLVVIYDTHLVNTQYPYWDPKELTDLVVTRLEAASFERGNEGNGWYPSLDLEISKTVVHNAATPKLANGQADYQQILNDHAVCSLVSEGSVDEVWVWSDRTGSMYEATMAGPQGEVFDLNGTPVVRNDCPKLVPIMGLNYEIYYDYRPDGVGGYEYVMPAVEMELHSFGHRFENTVAHYLDNKHRGNVVPGDTWYAYDGKIGYDGELDPNSFCGNAHYTPNASTFADEYIYWNKKIVTSSCRHWTPANYARLNFGCNLWDCWHEKYFVWWMQQMPGRCTSGSMQTASGQPMPNWWALVFNHAVVNAASDACAAQAPTLAELRLNATSYRLSWNEVPGVDRYEVVECGDKKCNKTTQVVTITGTALDLLNLPSGRHQYLVRGVSSVLEISGAASNKVTIKVGGK
jgi:hypothetical protein